MSQPCIITVAITGSLPKKKDNPAVPITVAEQIESTHEAFEAGATLVHLHVRNDEASPTSDPNASARAGGHPQALPRHDHAGLDRRPLGRRRERGGMLHLKPDMASLATGSVNFPTRVYENSPDLVDWLAAEMLKQGVKPEVEAFDLSMIFQAAAMQKAGKIKGPLHVQFVMGVKNAMPVDREVFEFYVKKLRDLMPGRDLDRRRHRRDQLTLARWSAGARRPLPHRPRGQRALRPGHARAVERRARAADGRAVRRARAPAGDRGRGA